MKNYIVYLDSLGLTSASSCAIRLSCCSMCSCCFASSTWRFWMSSSRSSLSCNLRSWCKKFGKLILENNKMRKWDEKSLLNYCLIAYLIRCWAESSWSQKYQHGKKHFQITIPIRLVNTWSLPFSKRFSFVCLVVVTSVWNVPFVFFIFTKPDVIVRTLRS